MSLNNTELVDFWNYKLGSNLFSDVRFKSLPFAVDVVLLAPSVLDLQLSLDGFTAQCQVARMRTSTSKHEAMVLSW